VLGSFIFVLRKRKKENLGIVGANVNQKMLNMSGCKEPITQFNRKESGVGYF
jgi:hypothetical protein